VNVVTLGWAPTCECNGKLVKKSITTIEVPDWSSPEFAAAAGIESTQRKMGNPQPREVEKVILEYKSDMPLEKHPVVPCVVLDPFAGAGTTGKVARSLGRSSIMIELNKQYARQAAKRADANTAPLEIAA
jgi:hypothetical protein